MLDWEGRVSLFSLFGSPLYHVIYIIIYRSYLIQVDFSLDQYFEHWLLWCLYSGVLRAPINKESDSHSVLLCITVYQLLLTV